MAPPGDAHLLLRGRLLECRRLAGGQTARRRLRRLAPRSVAASGAAGGPPPGGLGGGGDGRARSRARPRTPASRLTGGTGAGVVPRHVRADRDDHTADTGAVGASGLAGVCRSGRSGRARRPGQPLLRRAGGGVAQLPVRVERGAPAGLRLDRWSHDRQTAAGGYRCRRRGRPRRPRGSPPLSAGDGGPRRRDGRQLQPAQVHADRPRDVPVRPGDAVRGSDPSSARGDDGLDGGGGGQWRDHDALPLAPDGDGRRPRRVSCRRWVGSAPGRRHLRMVGNPAAVDRCDGGRHRAVRRAVRPFRATRSRSEAGSPGVEAGPCRRRRMRRTRSPRPSRRGRRRRAQRRRPRAAAGRHRDRRGGQSRRQANRSDRRPGSVAGRTPQGSTTTRSSGRPARPRET
jgi:hypothetical protein